MELDRLDPKLRDTLNDLFVQQQRPDPSWLLDDERCRLLLEGIEMAVVDPNRLRPYLQHLQKLLGTKLPPQQAVTEEEEQHLYEEQQTLLDHGLGRLDREQLQRLALDPVALLSLRAALFDRPEMPDHWWHRAQQSARERRPQIESLDEILGPVVEERYALAELGGPESGSAGPAEAVKRSTVLIPAGQLQWVEPASAPAPTDPSEANLELLVTYFEEQRRLEIQFSGIAYLNDRTRCKATLLDATGAVLGQAERQQRRLTFEDVSRERLPGLILEGEYQRAGGFHFRFRVPLQGR